MSIHSTSLGHDNFAPGESERLLGFKQLRPEKGVDYSREHLARKIKAGTFPPPVVLSTDGKGNPKKIAWLETEIDRWIADLAAKREHPAAA